MFCKAHILKIAFPVLNAAFANFFLKDECFIWLKFHFLKMPSIPVFVINMFG